MNINLLNAYCGPRAFPGPRLSQGRLASNLSPRRISTSGVTGCSNVRNVPRSPFRGFLLSGGRIGTCSAFDALRTEKLRPATTSRSRLVPCPFPGRLLSGDGDGSSRNASAQAWGRQSGPRLDRRVKTHLFRPEIRRDYPLNLSISLSGGKETNEDSPSNGE